MIDKVKVGAITYDIEYVSSDKLPDGEGGYIVNQTIKIAEALHDNLKTETLWHEIIHAINSELDEVMVEFLAQAIYQVLKENPELCQ